MIAPEQRITVTQGDSREVLKGYPDNYFDSVVTDPPYALVSIVKRFGKAAHGDSTKTSERVRSKADGYARAASGFMGQQWDTGETAFDPEFWAEVLRVLKPGGHVAAFSGTRTYHRMACAIEDAGFEVRNMLSWNFGSGFPKSHNISKTLDEKNQRCSCKPNVRDMPDRLDTGEPLSGSEEQDLRPGLLGSEHQSENGGADQGCSFNAVRNVRDANSSSAIAPGAERSGLLQRIVSEQDICGTVTAVRGEQSGEDATRQGAEGCGEPSVEGRSHTSAPARKLRQRSLHPVPGGIDLNGPQGRLCDGASAGDGKVGGPLIDQDGNRPSYGPSASEQSSVEPGTVAGQPEPQIGGTWEICGGCHKPMVPTGLGTDLKPAHEPICLARKPLSGKTVAANVLEHGTGAINIDGCRIGETKRTPGGAKNSAAPNWLKGLGCGSGFGPRDPSQSGMNPNTGRWPANIIHDGSAEVVALFPDSAGQQGDVTGAEPSDKTGVVLGEFGGRVPMVARNDSGSASRFFYTAKADAGDRIGSKHPTVKPVDLMQWLVRLITPPGGLVLEPFAGSGTTGEAAFREGMRCVMIEREDGFVADIRRRISLLLAGPEERARESIKAKIADGRIKDDAGPLFGSEVA